MLSSEGMRTNSIFVDQEARVEAVLIRVVRMNRIYEDREQKMKC